MAAIVESDAESKLNFGVMAATYCRSPATRGQAAPALPRQKDLYHESAQGRGA